MRILLGLSMLLGTLGAACGDDGDQTVLPNAVELAVGSHDFHDSANDAIVVAAKLTPDSGEKPSVSIAIVNEGGEPLADLTSEAPPSFDERCPAVARSAGWRIFAITGEEATEELLDQANRVRVQVVTAGDQKEFLLNLPNLRCSAVE